MTLKLLKPSLGYQRSPLPLLQHQAAGQVCERLTGSGLVAMRKRLLARSGGLCECDECMAGYRMKISLATMEADHILPLYQGGTNALGNFRALHRDCHKRITAEQAAERSITRRSWSDDYPVA